MPQIGVDPPDKCYRCGYDLRGIKDDHPCPECGLLAQRSRRPTDELHNTRPAWLRSLAMGSNLVLLSLLAGFFLPNFCVWVLSQISGSVGWSWMFWEKIIYAILSLPPLIFLCGIFLLTRPERYPPADQADRLLRMTLRTIAFVPLAVLTVQFLKWHQTTFHVSPQYNLADLVTFGLALFGLVPLPLLLFLRLRSLAIRARSAHLAEHCAIVGIGFSASILYAIAILVISENAEKWGWGVAWGASSKLSLPLMLILIVAAFLFFLWSIYLFIRFAISFNKAARQLRRNWKRDDLSEPQPS